MILLLLDTPFEQPMEKNDFKLSKIEVKG